MLISEKIITWYHNDNHIARTSHGSDDFSNNSIKIITMIARVVLIMIKLARIIMAMIQRIKNKIEK